MSRKNLIKIVFFCFSVVIFNVLMYQDFMYPFYPIMEVIVVLVVVYAVYKFIRWLIISKKLKKFLVFAFITIIVASIYLYETNRVKPIDFTDGMFYKYTYSIAGEDIEYMFYDRNVEVYADGLVRIYYDNFESPLADKYPVKEFRLTNDEIIEFKECLVLNKIMKFDERLSTDSCDGSFSWMTIYTKDSVHRSGGLNVENENYLDIESKLFILVSDEYREVQNAVYEIQSQYKTHE